MERAPCARRPHRKHTAKAGSRPPGAILLVAAAVPGDRDVGIRDRSEDKAPDAGALASSRRSRASAQVAQVPRDRPLHEERDQP
jgi:hypothetical protein